VTGDRARWPALLALAVALALPVPGQGAAVLPAGTCPAGTDFEREGYAIRRARVEGPFTFLRWVRREVERAARDVERLSGQPYRHAEVRARADELEQLSFLPDGLDQRVRISLVVASVEQCADRQLDLVYTVLSTQIAPVLSATYESRKAEDATPERSTGADDVTGRLRLSPSAGYDRAEDLHGGARLEYRLGGRAAERLPLDSIVVDGRASTAMHEVSATLAGASDAPLGPIARFDWQLSYLSSSEPSDQAQLRKDRLAAQLSAMTRPLGPWQLPVRFGGLLEGGSQQSDFRSAVLPPDTVASADYGAAKAYVGTTTRLDRHALSLSYGLEMGAVGPALRADWVKHVGDLAHRYALRLGDHRALDLESRLTAGILQVPGSVPVATRFFGGGREQLFVPGSGWAIRANPVMRGLPANRLDRSSEGPGGTRFFAYNLTAAFPVWRRPVVPRELSRDPEFTTQVNGAMASATSIIQKDHAARDPHYRRAAGRIGEVREALAALAAAVTAVEPGDAAAAHRGCVREIGTADRRARAALEAKGAAQYGYVAALLTADETEDRLNRVREACVGRLAAELDDAAAVTSIRAAADRLEAVRVDMEGELALIDQSAATGKAEAEMTYVTRTFNTLVHDLNIAAISPVAIVDVAHIGPAGARLGTRYGVGGGLRLTLVNSVDFTVGYVANLHRVGREPAGAFFFTIQFKDLLE